MRAALVSPGQLALGRRGRLLALGQTACDPCFHDLLRVRVLDRGLRRDGLDRGDDGPGKVGVHGAHLQAVQSQDGAVDWVFGLRMW